MLIFSLYTLVFTLNATMTALYSLNNQQISNSTTTFTNSTTGIVPLPKAFNESTIPIFENSSFSTAIPILISTTATTPLSTIAQPFMIIQARWNKTDALLRQIGQSLATKGYLDFESDVYDQLEKLRNKCVHQVGSAWPTTPNSLNSGKSNKSNTISPSAVINISGLWPLFTDCVRTFEQSFAMLDKILMKEHFTSFAASRSERQQLQQVQYSKMTMTDLLIRNMPYTLFVRGIVHRFTSLSFGLILVR